MPKPLSKSSSLLAFSITIVAFVGLFVIVTLVQKQVIQLPFAKTPNQNLGTANLKKGSPEWKMYVIDNSSRGADGTKLGDVNKDGLMDIVTGWEQGGVTKVYLNPGISRVKTNWPNVRIDTTSVSVEDAVFGDLDKDGFLDVIISNEGNNKSIHISWGPKGISESKDQSKWNIETLPASNGKMKWMFAEVFDVNNDGKPDIIAGGKQQGAQIGWFESPPTDPRKLSDWVWHPISNVSWVMSIIIDDMDSDGDQDILISDRNSQKDDDEAENEPELAFYSGASRWLENPGVGGTQKDYWKSHTIISGYNTRFLDLNDVDGDNLKDVVTAVAKKEIIISRRLSADGKSWQTYQVNVPEESGKPKSVSIGDINLDGKKDLVITTVKAEKKEAVIWMTYKNNPFEANNWVASKVSGTRGVKYDFSKLIDLDGDGDLDILTSEEVKNLGVIWFENPTK